MSATSPKKLSTIAAQQACCSSVMSGELNSPSPSVPPAREDSVTETCVCVRRLNLFCLITCHTNAKNTRCGDRWVATRFITRTHNTYFGLLLTATQAPNKRAACVKAGGQIQGVCSHWLATSAFASAQSERSVVPFH